VSYQGNPLPTMIVIGNLPAVNYNAPGTV